MMERFINLFIKIITDFVKIATSTQRVRHTVCCVCRQPTTSMNKVYKWTWNKTYTNNNNAVGGFFFAAAAAAALLSDSITLFIHGSLSRWNGMFLDIKWNEDWSTQKPVLSILCTVEYLLFVGPKFINERWKR